MKIRSIDAIQVLDSRGVPTVEAAVSLDDGVVGKAIVPSGASTGTHEAWELRDAGSKRFGGRSVGTAVENVRGEIATRLRGCDVFDQSAVDQLLISLDGTPNKSRLGANAVLAVSMATCAAAAAARRQPLFEYLGGGHGNLLPMPEIQIIGGGRHAGQAIDVQDFMITTIGAMSFGECLEIATDVYRKTGEVLRRYGKLIGVADEGGYWPQVACHDEVFEIILQSITEAGYTPGKDVSLSLDIAATDLYDGDRYHLRSEGKSFSSNQFSDLVLKWTRQYPIVSLEDPLSEDDWEGWQRLTATLGQDVQLIGDDVFTTNVARIERGIVDGVANSVLIKLNQIGTVSETIEAIRLTQSCGRLPVISARSGETEDTFISHLAVAFNAGQLKVGSIVRGERTAKWNEVLRIERILGDRARFASGSPCDRLRGSPDKAGPSRPLKA